MKSLGQRYLQYINCTYKRSGTLWEGRFRSSIIQQHEYLFSCQRYIEMNPVHVGIVKHPGEYRWSSYQSNGWGKHSDQLSCHSLYLSLGQTDVELQTELIGNYFVMSWNQEKLIRYEKQPMEIMHLVIHVLKKKSVRCLGGVLLPEKQEGRGKKQFITLQNNFMFFSKKFSDNPLIQ